MMKLTLIRVIILSVISLCFFGCGGDTGGLYTAGVTFSDGPNDEALGFDLYMDICTPAVGATPPKYEEFTDVVANITLAVEEGMPGITVNNYSINYIGQSSVNSFGNLIQPPDLDSLTGQTGNGNNNLHVDTSSSMTFSIECFSTTQKQEFIDLAGIDYTAVPVDPDEYTARYTIRIVLHCTDDSGYDRDIEIRRTVYFDNYRNC